ncbi:MAG TPA: ABC transporter ATP-binding protein [Acidobacteriota bacterium]|nr:ABC transporter ATP-binding protein [Acidobacteriota bacterium]
MSAVLTVRDVCLSYRHKAALSPGRDEDKQVLRGVSFQLHKGESLGLVGESGSGKTSLARCLLGINEPDSGEIVFSRGGPGKVQAIFQDPLASLNPLMTVTSLILEPLRVASRHLAAEESMKRVRDLLPAVSLPPGVLDRKPSQLSAGQRQRVAIARALATDPEILIADEPTSALDASLRVQILELLRSAQRSRDLAMLMVTHDLAAAARYCDRIAVLYQGRLVETLPSQDLFGAPQHPYTRRLARLVLEK